MTEPTSASLAAATAVTTGTLTLAGNVLGIPADSMLGAVLGAGIAMSGAPRLETTRASVLNAVGIFSTSLILAVFLGPLVSIVADQALTKLTGIDLPDDPLRAAASLLVAIGLQRRLPALLDKLTSRIGGQP
jgi:hypothetical protein